MKHIKAFTLVELLIAIFISVIVLMWVLKFVADTLAEISFSNKSSQLIVWIQESHYKLEQLVDLYEHFSILSDHNISEGTDIVLLHNSGSTEGVLLSLVNPSTSKIFSWMSSYQKYSKKHLGYRLLNESEVTFLIADPSKAYNMSFHDDKVFRDVFFEDFQAKLYNSWSILELKFSLLFDYEFDKEWLEWDDIGRGDLYNISLHF